MALLSASQAQALHRTNGDVRHPGNLLGLSCCLTAIAVSAVGARLYTRFLVVRSPSLDDAFLVTALLFLVGILVTYIVQDQWGSGYHASTLTPNEVIHFFRSFWAMLWCYCGCLACVKMSLLIQYGRLFATPNFRLAVRVLFVVVALASVWSICSGIFICWPISYFWTRQGEGKCLQTWPLFIGNAVLNILTDLLVLGSPLPVLHHLHLPSRQRYALMGLFTIGFFVVIISAVRLAVFVQSEGATDFSWEQIVLGGWSFAECAVAVICASIPAMKPLLVRIFPRFAGSTNRSHAQAGYYPGASRIKSQKDLEPGTTTEIGYVKMVDIGGDTQINKGDRIKVMTSFSANRIP